MKGWFRTSLALCSGLLAACDVNWGGGGGGTDETDETDETELPRAVNVINCSQYPIVVSWKVGSVLAEDEDSFTLPFAHGPADTGCGANRIVDFLDGQFYQVTITKDIDNCYDQGTCTDSTPWQFKTNPEGPIATRKVE